MTNQNDKLSSRSSREKRALEERIKMAELMAELKYIERRQSLELETRRI